MLTTFASVMKEFAGAFVTDKRNDGKTFYKLSDNAPEWLKGSDVMFTIHSALDDRLPDDWVYEATASITSAFVDHESESADDARETAHEVADGLVDVYNADRIQWLAQHLNNASIVDEACRELGCAADTDIVDRIGTGQYYAYERLANAVIEAVETEADSRE